MVISHIYIHIEAVNIPARLFSPRLSIGKSAIISDRDFPLTQQRQSLTTGPRWQGLANVKKLNYLTKRALFFIHN